LREVPPGVQEIPFLWEAEAGTVVAEIVDAAGKVLDRREHTVHDATTQPVTLTRLEFGGADPIRLTANETAVVFDGPGALLRGVVNNMLTTMYSWFGHAEALSAQVAVRALILAAIHRKIIDDEGFEQTLRVDLDKAVRDLHERFYDPATGLVRPFPGMAPNALWAGWVSRNLHAARRAITGTPTLRARLARPLGVIDEMTRGIDRALAPKNRGPGPQNRGAGPLEVPPGYDAQRDGLETIPVEIDGKVVWQVITDDAVQRFVVDRLAPLIDPETRNAELAFARAYDTFRFLRAFKRTGALQYMTEAAKAAFLAGPRGRQAFARLFKVVAQGMIATQEPGMIQGPALLGGVYSTPMAMVRFLELMLLTGAGKCAPGSIRLKDKEGSRTFSFGARIAPRGDGTLLVPAGAIVRVDRPGRITLAGPAEAAGPAAFAQCGAGADKTAAKLSVSKGSLTVGEEAVLHVALGSQQDPLEYAAIIALPTTVSAKQTEDILSDYRGSLIYGQRSAGATKIQFLAVPFRGSRDMQILLEGLYPGSSDAVVAIRLMSNPADTCLMVGARVTVRRSGETDHPPAR